MNTSDVTAWFLGPRAENAALERSMLVRILENYFEWRRDYFPDDRAATGAFPAPEDFQQRLCATIERMLADLRRDYPFYSPRYIGHMVSDQTLPSVLGYFAGLLYNPNNVTGEAAPATLQWELEIGADILRMLGYLPPPADGHATHAAFGWAHVTSGGTVANLEALWLARNVRYFPLAVQDVCQRHGIPFAMNLRGDAYAVDSLSPEACLGVDPAESIDQYARLIAAVRRHWDLAGSEAIRTTHELLRDSKFNIAHHGTGAAYSVRPPALLASGARHYSITKAADLLGIGRDNIVLVDVDARFRMDIGDLRARMNQLLQARSLPVAVVGIAGTTEQGAVDPIDKIALLRDQNQILRGESFWLHVDAAWGGYLRTLFTPDDRPAAIREFVARDLEIRSGDFRKRVHLDWGADDVCASFAAFPRADSITVDPHKLGYVPYPCGVAAYKNDLVRQFITEEIPYISDVHLEDTDPRHHRAPRSVGPFILEGSKPGSAVAGCWLSHRTIPLHRDGHGKILRGSLLAARELYERLVAWNEADRALPYRILPIAEQPPDTNVVCFFVRENPPLDLAHTNALNRSLHRYFTLQPTAPPPPFFLSRTTFSPTGDSCAGIRALLERAQIEAADYRLHGLFVLRATVMSPYHDAGNDDGAGAPLFAEFMDCLHQQVLAELGVGAPLLVS